MTATQTARPRTAAASAEWRRRGAKRAAIELLTRLPHLEDQSLASVTERLLVECAARGIDARALMPPEPVAEPAWSEAT